MSHLRVPAASDEATSISLGEQEWISHHVWWELDLHNSHVDELDWPYEKDYVDCNNHGTRLNSEPQVCVSWLLVTGTHKPILPFLLSLPVVLFYIRLVREFWEKGEGWCLCSLYYASHA